MTKMKKVLSLVLAFVMTASLFSNWPMPVFAADSVKGIDLMPVVSATISEDVTLYGNEKAEGETVITLEEPVEITVYKSYTMTETGKITYQFYLPDNASDELKQLVGGNMFIGGATIGLPEYAEIPQPTVEPTVEPILGISEDDTGSNDVSTENFNIDEDGKYYIDHAAGISVKSADEKMTTVRNITVEPVSKALGNIPANSADYLIWNSQKSLFYDITLTDENGNAVILDGDVTVVFSKDIIPFNTAFSGSDYTVQFCYIYRFDEDGKVCQREKYDYKLGEDFVATYNGLSVVGFAAMPYDVNRTDIGSLEVTSKDGNIKLYNLDPFDLTDYVNVTIAEGERFTVGAKFTATDGVNSVEMYELAFSNAYIGKDNNINNLINNNYVLIRVSDVIEYVEPTVTPTPEPTPEVTPEPTPDIPVLEDTILKDEETGITVSGEMPEKTELSVESKKLTDQTINEEIYPLGDHTKVYNVSLTKDGKEITSNGDLTVNIPESELDFELMTGYFLYQVYPDGAVKANGPYVYTGGDVNLSINEASCLIYTDPFVEASTVNWKRYFNKDSVTIYDSPLSIANKYVLKNATEEIFIVDYYFVDKNDTTWYMVYNDFTPELETEYVFIKALDTSKTKVIIPDITITDDKNNTGVSIVGKLPEGTTATIKQVTEIDSSIDTSMYPMGENPFILDITLYDEDGNETQPDSPVDVVIPADYFAGNEGKFYIGYHIYDGEIELLGPFEYTGDDIYVTVDHFSYIVFGDGYKEESIDPPYQAVFTSDTVTLFRDHISTEISEENSVTVDVTENDIVEVYMMYTFDDGTVKYALDYKLVEGDENFNEDLYDTISNFDTPIKNIVLADSIKKYVKPEPQILVDPVTGISVDGNFPSGAYLSVTPVARENLNLGENYPLGNNVSAFDIKVIFEGEEYQPNGEVTINLPKKNFNFNQMSAYMLYHTHGDSTSALGPFVYTGNDINLKVEGFSQFVYTDTFVEATTVNKTFYFTNKFATLYDSPLPGAATYTPVEALEGDYIAHAYYVDNNGTKWVAFYNNSFADFATEYIYVKDTDVSFESRVNTFDKVAPLYMGSPSTYTALQSRAIMPLDETKDNGLELDKYISKDGKNIVLEVFTTGQKTITPSTTQVPTDIVLVLDQSGSMDGDMEMTEYIEISGTAKEAHAYATAMDGLYAKVGDSYVEVNITATGTTETTNVYFPWSTKEGYTGRNSYFNGNDRRTNLYYNDGTGYWPVTISHWESGWIITTDHYSYVYTKNGQTITIEDDITGDTTVPPFASQLYYASPQATRQNYTFTYTGADSTQVTDTYTANQTVKADTYYYALSSTTTRLEALKRAVATFAESVSAKANPDGVFGSGDEVNHRIAVIGFSGKENSYSNTELFIGSQQINYRNVNNTYYQQAFQDMDVKADQDNITASINALVADGSTYVHRGMDLANGVLDANPVPSGETRNRVIVVFTDGVPGYSTSWYNDSKSTGEAAIAQANIAKANGVTVYAVGIFDDADPTIAGSWNDNATTKNKANYYMQNMSSNNGTPQTPSYYLAASDGGALNNIFKTIAGNIESGGSSTTLTEETVVKDIVSPYFKLPEGADVDDIKIYTATVTGKDASGNYTWANRVEFEEGQATIYGKTINVTNYDFSENWVGAIMNNGAVSGYHGSKLIIEIPFVVEPLFLGGNGAVTNDDFAGVYADDEATSPIEEFVKPTVSVPVKQINPVTKDQHIYLSNNANLKELITKFFVEGQEQVDINKFIDGINNAYVDITYTIKDGDTVIGTLTIPRKTSYDEAVADVDNWDLEDGQTWTPALETDKTYTIVCDVNGGEGNTSQGIGTATVYVYKPTITVKDSIAYLGDANYPVIDIAHNVVSIVWSHSDINTVNDKDENYAIAKETVNGKDVYYIKNAAGKVPFENDYYSMYGTEPELEISNDAPTGRVTQKGDIPVNITAVIRAEENNGDKVSVTILHQNCEGKTCTLTNGAELFIHVYSPELKFKDSRQYIGSTVPTDLSSHLERYVWSNPTLGEIAEPANIAISYVPSQASGTTITTSADITVDVSVTNNGHDIAQYGIFTRDNCVTGETLPNGAEFVIHVFTPSLSVKDSHMYFGTDIPTDFTSNIDGAITWSTSVQGVTTDGMGTAPAVTLDGTAGTKTYVDQAGDITVTLDAKVAGVDVDDVTITHTDCDGQTENNADGTLLIHAYIPEITFKDSKAYLGNNVPSEFDTNNKAGIIWKNAVFGQATANVQGTPTALKIGYDCAVTGPITTAADIPVNVTSVTMNKGGNEITVPATYGRDNCFDKEVLPYDAEFVIHVFAPTFTTLDTFVYMGSAVPTDAQYKANNIRLTGWSHPTVDATGIIGTAPTPEYTFVTDISGDMILTTANDVKVTATVKLGGNAISNDNITINHTACTNVKDIELAEGQFLLHVLKPHVTFKDLGVYYSNTWPTDNDLQTAIHTVEWQYADTDIETIDNVTAPALAYTFEYVKDGATINTSSDIVVDAHITLGNVNIDDYVIVEANECEIKDETADATDFLLHVFTPVVPLIDQTVYYGSTGLNLSASVDSEKITWKNNDVSAASGFMIGNAPEYKGFGCDTVAPIVEGTVLTGEATNKTVITPNDIPYVVTNVLFGTQLQDLIGVTSFVKDDDCTKVEGTDFIIHVKTVSLDVSKIVEGVTTDEEFEVTLTINGNVIPEELNYDLGTTSGSVETNSNRAVIHIKQNETYKFTELPIGTYIVQEKDYEPKYITTTSVVNGTAKDKRTAEMALESDNTTYTVTFNNRINLTSLTIYKEVEGNTYNVKDSFIFNVYAGDSTTPYATVVLQNREYVTIPDLVVGTVYRVEEVTDWSWRYNSTVVKTPNNNTLVYDTAEGTERSLNLYSFNNVVETPLYWLDNESNSENIFN